MNEHIPVKITELTSEMEETGEVIGWATLGRLTPEEAVFQVVIKDPHVIDMIGKCEHIEGIVFNAIMVIDEDG